MNWEVQLVGDSTDLRTLADVLRERSMTVSEEGGEFILRSSDFDGITNTGEVRSRATEIMTSLSGLSRLVLGAHRELSLGAVSMVDTGGRKHIYLAVEPAVARSSVSPIGIMIQRVDGTVEVHRPGDPVRDWIPLAGKDPAVAKALRLRNSENLGWVELYRLSEVIEAAIGGFPNIVQHGWASASELRSFKHTANSVSAVGDEARHGKESTRQPRKPMKLSQARELVDRILKSWLRSMA